MDKETFSCNPLTHLRGFLSEVETSKAWTYLTQQTLYYDLDTTRLANRIKDLKKLHIRFR